MSHFPANLPWYQVMGPPPNHGFSQQLQMTHPSSLPNNLPVSLANSLHVNYNNMPSPSNGHLSSLSVPSTTFPMQHVPSVGFQQNNLQSFNSVSQLQNSVPSALHFENQRSSVNPFSSESSPNSSNHFINGSENFRQMAQISNPWLQPPPPISNNFHSNNNAVTNSSDFGASPLNRNVTSASPCAVNFTSLENPPESSNFFPHNGFGNTQQLVPVQVNHGIWSQSPPPFNNAQNSSHFTASFPNRNNCPDTFRRPGYNESFHKSKMLPGFGRGKPTNFNFDSGASSSSTNIWNNGKHLQNSSNGNRMNYNRPNSHQGNHQNRSFQRVDRHSGNFHKNQDRNGKFKDKQDYEQKPFACDTCDRAFSLEADFRSHISEHIKCSYSNCSFEAHPKIVFLHKKMQHDTGYAEVISKLNDDDEIAKWRAERKRRFPTTENIRKRKAEQAEKEARGEIVEDQDFGKMKRQKLDHRNSNKRNKRSRFRNSRHRNVYTVPKVSSVAEDSDTDSDDDSHIKLHKFMGINSRRSNEVSLSLDSNGTGKISSTERDQDKESLDVSLNSSDQMSAYCQMNSEENNVNDEEVEAVNVPIDPSELNDNDSDNGPPIEIPIKKSVDLDISVSHQNHIDKIVPAASNDVTTLNCTDSDDELSTEIPTTKAPLSENFHGNSSENHKDNEDSSQEGPSEVPIGKVPLNEISNSTDLREKSVSSDIQDTKKDGGNTHNKFSKKGKREPQQRKSKETDNVYPECPTRMLNMLYGDHIRHERNVIMQVIRYVVSNKFFDQD